MKGKRRKSNLLLILLLCYFLLAYVRRENQSNSEGFLKSYFRSSTFICPCPSFGHEYQLHAICNNAWQMSYCNLRTMFNASAQKLIKEKSLRLLVSEEYSKSQTNHRFFLGIVLRDPLKVGRGTLLRILICYLVHRPVNNYQTLDSMTD